MSGIINREGSLYKIKLMKPIFNQMPESSFWDELNLKVVEIGERTRSRQRRLDLSEPKVDKVRKLSRFEIEKQYHEQLQQEQRISNRIRFLQTERERRSKALQQAKHKYERLMKIRTQSFREKKQSKQIIAQNQTELIRSASKQVSLVKKSRQKVSLSVQKSRELHELSARQIRSTSLQNQEVLKTERQLQIQHKKQQVVKMHQTLELSRLRMSTKREQMNAKARIEYRSYLESKVKVNQAQHTRNSFLKQKLHQSLLTCNKERQKELQQLKQYTLLIKKQKSQNRKLSSMQTTSC